MTLEGALGPNSRLDDAESVRIAAPEAICVNRSGQLMLSSGRDVFRLPQWGYTPAHWANFETPVSALAASEDGRLAVGLADGQIVVLDEAGKPLSGWIPSTPPRAVADCLFLPSDEIAIVDHGYGSDEPLLSLAPWDSKARGQVIAVNQTGATRVIATGLHCPMGIAAHINGALIVTEFERARVIETSGRTIQAGYPAYLGRIRKIGEGYALACLARRDPLIEFLKTERQFVARMKANIDPRYWIGPRATPEFSPDFPIELGATRLFGEVKPWAPSFSYGLVIETNPDLMPIGSAHSRANGVRHAISDVMLWNGSLIAVSRASNEILKLARQDVP
ncbi:MAG TPA: hypothetical protein VGG27_10285 [Magnetospirillaceae bacterium]|jgi:hypothetical protein